MSKILQKLKGGDLRSIGRSDEVTNEVLRDPSFFGQVFEGMYDADPRIRMRSADAIEKIAKERPEYLQPFKKRLINEASKVKQQEVRWHIAQMFSYLKISKKERDVIIKILLAYIREEKSNIVKVFSLQTLAGFAESDKQLRPRAIKLIRKLMENGSPSLISRGKKLLAGLERRIT